MSDIVNRLRKNRDCYAPSLMDQAADEIVRLQGVTSDLIKERDEARREVCEMTSRIYMKQSYEYAHERGWNCFNEESSSG